MGLAVFLLTVLCGCRTAPLPPVDLSQPSWSVRQGQAVWVQPSSTRKKEEGVAGELLVATGLDGSSWVQFSKPPFNLVTARRSSEQWRVEFQQGRQSRAGRGQPPTTLIWFQLAEAIAGNPPGAPWGFHSNADGSWILENPTTGERLEGYLSP